MKNVFCIALVTGIVGSFALSGCSPLTITFGAAPSPVVIIVTATPPPTEPPPPSLTPLPVFPSATPTSAPIPTATVAASPTNALVQPPPPPQPPQPQPTPLLPQLSVSDQGGGNMDVFVFGGQVGWQMAFRAVACSPNCNNRPDGRDVNSVYFAFFKRLPDGTLKWVFEHTESSAPYCSFGGSGVCDLLDIRNPNTRWPGTQTVVENGDYVLQVEAEGKNRASWHGSFNFRVQR
jgi:hypothetical protein